MRNVCVKSAEDWKTNQCLIRHELQLSPFRARAYDFCVGGMCGERYSSPVEMETAVCNGSFVLTIMYRLDAHNSGGGLKCNLVKF